jgi:alpha-D-xyloside xylohydrolase
MESAGARARVSAFDVEAPRWSAISPLAAKGPAEVSGGCVRLESTVGLLRVSLHDFGARIRIGTSRRDYGILTRQPDALAVRVDATDAATRIVSGDVELRIEHSPLSFELHAQGRTVLRSPSDGHFVRRFRVPPFARVGERWLMSLDLEHDARVYGLGEKWGRLDRRGQLVRSYNQDALGVNAEASYKNAPFAWSPDGWGVFVHTVAPVTHGVGYAPWSQRAYCFIVDEEGLDVFLFTGRDGPELVSQYTALTGRAPVPPLWSLGAILSKAYYKDADEILGVAREVRARGMPCDTITFDGRAWQDTDTRFAFEWCPKRYPDPGPVIAALKALDFRICVWEYPLISVRNPLFGELAAKGWLLKDARTGEPYRYRFDPEPFGAVLTQLPESGLIDFTHPDAYAYWRDRHRALFDAGIDMIKADFGEQVEQHAIAHDGAQGDALHNAYALLYNRCVYEAAERHGASGAFLFSRAAWAGQQRYPSQWGGDPQADWGGLAASLRGALSWGLTGGPYFATDVGGFYGDTRDPLLYVRWCQAAVFAAHMRLHGIGPREPWSYGAAAERAAMQALRLRYRLLPYLQNAMMAASATGLPVQRAMALACPRERASWSYEHQFFFGAELLVAPCLDADGVVRVYLPEGEWRRFDSGERLEGGREHELRLTLEELAVFARADARIPLGRDVLHTGELGGRPTPAGWWPG